MYYCIGIGIVEVKSSDTDYLGSLMNFQSPQRNSSPLGAFVFMEYRKYYSYTYSDWKRELQDSHFSKYLLHKEIMYKLRTYACLFNRDMRKKYINEKSYCAHCFTNENLTIDHIIPISKGGKNVERNIQILCRKCNRKKGNKI